MKTTPKIKISILNRREALKQLRDLGILGLGGLLGLQQGIRQKNVAIESLQDFIPYSTHTKINPLFSSNIPQEILSLPLKHFSIPYHFKEIITQPRKRYKNEKFITSLVGDTYLEYTNYYLSMPFKHKNLDFFTYHYKTLDSLTKDLEKNNFYLRSIDIENLNLTLIKELYFLLSENQIEKDFYLQYDLMGSYTINAYHTAMNYLDDVYRDCFNTNLKDNTPNLQKHREFLKALNVIGENNIKALYVGIGDKNDEEQNPNSSRVTSKRREKASDSSVNAENNEKKRPKFIGRLATTIIMEDGLWIG